MGCGFLIKFTAQWMMVEYGSRFDYSWPSFPGKGPLLSSISEMSSFTQQLSFLILPPVASKSHAGKLGNFKIGSKQSLLWFDKFFDVKTCCQPKKLNLAARNSSFCLFSGSKNLTSPFEIGSAQASFVLEQSYIQQKCSRERRQSESASTFGLGRVTFLGCVT